VNEQIHECGQHALAEEGDEYPSWVEVPGQVDQALSEMEINDRLDS
jgi:hypothetical protein